MNAPIDPRLTEWFTRGFDTDPDETQEWQAAFEALIQAAGPERATFILQELARTAQTKRLNWQPALCTPYINTIDVNDQPPFPGNLAIEEKLSSIMRWNALAMVVRANQAYGELGGHIASYASGADLFETGFNHFFHGREGLADGQHRGDLVFLQPHSAPGIYARAFLEGRLTETDLMHFRQEITATKQGTQGLCSYPHPMLMPDFWQFPTGSMGIGPI
ncbi:MAG TPA: pyruvate dehydrogenase (acetyl-transferring), homodimeric type, partial [Orrella sp.]